MINSFEIPDDVLICLLRLMFGIVCLPRDVQTVSSKSMCILKMIDLNASGDICGVRKAFS